MKPIIYCYRCGDRLKIVEEDTHLYQGRDRPVYYTDDCKTCRKEAKKEGIIEGRTHPDAGF